jgi:uncharacterized protein YciI
MRCVLLYHSTADGLAKAKDFAAAHRGLQDEAHKGGGLIQTGPYVDPSQGSMAIFKDRAAAEAFVKADPYVANGVVSRWEMHDWKEQY